MKAEASAYSPLRSNHDDAPVLEQGVQFLCVAERHRFRLLCASSESVVQPVRRFECTPEANAFGAAALDTPVVRHEAL